MIENCLHRTKQVVVGSKLQVVEKINICSKAARGKPPKHSRGHIFF